MALLDGIATLLISINVWMNGFLLLESISIRMLSGQYLKKINQKKPKRLQPLPRQFRKIPIERMLKNDHNHNKFEQPQ